MHDKTLRLWAGPRRPATPRDTEREGEKKIGQTDEASPEVTDSGEEPYVTDADEEVEEQFRKRRKVLLAKMIHLRSTDAAAMVTMKEDSI